MAQSRALLLVGGPDYHNQPEHYAELAGILAGEGGIDLRITADLTTLNTTTLAEYDAVVNWSTFVSPTEDQVDALLQRIDDGMGFFAIHGGSATFWNSAPYLTMLGSRFIQHDPYKAFLVEINDREHPVTRGVENFLIEDELYEQGGRVEDFVEFAAAARAKAPYEGQTKALGEGPLGADIHVIASAEGHPLLYTRDWGKGRVHYNALGHDGKALRNPNFRKLVLQGYSWVTRTGE